MAEDIKRTVWRLEGQAKDIISQLEAVKSQFQSANKAANQFSSTTKTSSKTIVQQYKETQGIVNKLKFSIDQLRIARDKSNSTGLIDKYNQKISQQEAKLKSLIATERQVGKFTPTAGGSVFGGLSGVIAGAAGGFAIASLTSALNELGRASIDAAVKFEKSLSSLSSLTGLVGQDLKFFEEAAKDLSISEIDGVKVSASADELVRAFSLVASSKPELLSSRDALIDVTKEAIILAEASGLALPDAVKALTASMNQFGAGAERTREFIDALAAGAKFGAAEIPEITDAIVKFGVGAKQSNISIQESVALIELFGEKGLQGAEAGTKLNAILTKISGAKGLDRAALESLKQYGVNLDVITDKSIPFEQRLRELAKIRKDDVALLRVFGIENINASKTLLNNIDRYKDLSIQIQDTGVALDQATINTNNSAASMKEFNNQLALLKLTIGDLALPFILDGLKQVQGNVSILTQLIEGLTKAVRGGFGDFLKFVDKLKEGNIIGAFKTGLDGLSNTFRIFSGQGREAAESLNIFDKAGLEAATMTEQDLTIALNNLAASGNYSREQLLKMADDLRAKNITAIFNELSKSLAITRTQFDELTKITDKYGVSARITSEAILGLKSATDLQLQTIFESQKETINASEKDFNDYIALLKSFKTKAEAATEDLGSSITPPTDEEKKKAKELANELENLRKQLAKIIDERELFFLNQNKGIEGIELMNDHLRRQLQLQLGIQKAELERKGLISSSPELDNAFQRQARALFEEIQEQSFLLFDAEARKKIDDFNKYRLQKEQELQFKIRQLQLTTIQGDEDSLVTAANERFDRERDQAIENAKITGEDITLVIAEIEQRRHQEILNIRRQFQQEELEDEFKLLDIEERERLAKVKTGTVKEEQEKAAIRLQFAQERLKLAQELLDELLDLEEKSGTNVELRKQIEELQIKIRELNLEMSKGTGDAAQKMERNLQKIAKVLTDIQTITDAIIDGIRKVIAEEQRQTDFQIEQQQKRIDAATELAEKGNAELLQQEKDRMEKLLAERKKQVAAQKALDAIQFVSSSVVAIANAAAAGGGFFSIATIAAVIGAIAGGIALVSSLVSGFRHGEVDIQGKGTSTSDSIPARLSRGESVTTAEKTKVAKRTLTDIRDGRFTDEDLKQYKEWKNKRSFFIDYSKMSLSKFSQRIVLPEQSIALMQSKTDVTGIQDRLDKMHAAIKQINTQVPVMNDKGVFHLSKQGEKKTTRIFKRP